MEQNNDVNRVPQTGALIAIETNTNAAPEPFCPRVRNLQDLMKVVMVQSEPEYISKPSELGPMDEERRKFLQEALKSMTVDVVGIMMSAIKVLTNSEKMKGIQLGDELPDDVSIAFENILSYVNSIDVANDFFKVGGFAIFPVCYDSANDKVRCNASQILAEVCQNNPFCQKKALEGGLLNMLLQMITTERGSPLAKCVSALSSATRGLDEACAELTAKGGCEALAALLADEHVAAKGRAAFFIAHLCHSYAPAKEKFIEQNVVRPIAEQIALGRDEATERLLSVLDALVEDQRVVRQCRASQLNLKRVLEDHLNRPESADLVEEQEYCQHILNIIDAQPEAGQGEVHR